MVAPGERFYSESLDRHTPYLVQVTDDEDDRLIGLFDLDGEAIPFGSVAEWEVEAQSKIPRSVIKAFEDEWSAHASLKRL